MPDAWWLSAVPAFVAAFAVSRRERRHADLDEVERRVMLAHYDQAIADLDDAAACLRQTPKGRAH